MSGNHGGDKKIDIPNGMATTIPKQSQKVFVAPDAILKNSPSIKELIKEPVSQSVSQPAAPDVKPAAEDTSSTENESQQPEPQSDVNIPTEDSVIAAPTSDSASQSDELGVTTTINDSSNVEITEKEINTPPQPPVKESPEPAPAPTENATPLTDDVFLKIWNNMVETVFGKVPTLYSSLKNPTLKLNDHTIYLTFRNDQQENDFNIKKIEVLRILRESDNSINDIITNVDHQLVTKKYIIDDAEKVEELRRQNADIDDFLKTLNLRIH